MTMNNVETVPVLWFSVFPFDRLALMALLPFVYWQGTVLLEKPDRDSNEEVATC
jgi:hypothetical protein